MYAYEIWKRDDFRKKLIENKGCEVLVVWEYDYKKNKEKIIQKCVDFLKN